MSETCGREDCGTCIRQDSEIWEGGWALVNYVGEYAVITSMPVQHLSPAYAMIAEALGIKMPPRYLTSVVYVKDLSIRDSEGVVPDDDFHRFMARHDDDDKAKEAHAMVVDGVRSGLIDVSAPLTDEEFEEQMAY